MIAAFLVAISCVNGKTSNSQSNDKVNSNTPAISTSTAATVSKSTSAEAEVVEVMYMYGKQRCVTCIAIGTEAEAVVKELASDKVVMKSVDFSTAEGEKIADKYEIASSSLIVVKGGKVDNLTAMSFQYAKNNPEQFRKKLKESIKKMAE